MDGTKLNVLLFSPSARKVWVQPMTKILNPSYWLIAYLSARLGDIHNVYTIEKSFSPLGKVKTYRDEKIDVIVSIGASYNPGTLKAEFNKGFPAHDRAFDIGYITKRVFKRDNPLHVNLCVDVRPWFDSLTEVFGKEPDAYITEQEMKWQQVGYLMNNALWERSNKRKLDYFFFSGGVKSRQDRFLHLTKNINRRKVIHGGGWDKYLKKEDEYICEGFNQYHVSVKKMLEAMWGLVIHEPLGNQEGWITAKLFEHLGSRTIAFVDSQYDKGEIYIPKNHVLRVDTPDDIELKINSIGYDALLEEQNKLIKPEWGDKESFYVKPFLEKFNSIWDQQKT